jgi:hypothetical protein
LRHARSAGGTDGERDSEIRDECLILVKEDVLGLDVAVYNTLFMRRLEGTQHFARNSHCIVYRKLRFALEANTERFARDVGHHVVEKSVGFA